MDKFGVPKKINRHVLKAIYTLHEGGLRPDANDICDFVEVAMRNNVPVRNMNSVVAQSLRNMVKFGIISRDGANYSVRDVRMAPSVSSASSRDSELDKLRESDTSSEDEGFAPQTDRSADVSLLAGASHGGWRLSEAEASIREIQSDGVERVEGLWIEKGVEVDFPANPTQNEIQNDVESLAPKSVASKRSSLLEDNPGFTVNETQPMTPQRSTNAEDMASRGNDGQTKEDTEQRTTAPQNQDE